MSLNKDDWAVVAIGVGIKDDAYLLDAKIAALDIAGHYQTLTDSEKIEFLKDAKQGVEQAIILLQQAADKVAAEIAAFNDVK